MEPLFVKLVLQVCLYLTRLMVSAEELAIDVDPESTSFVLEPPERWTGLNGRADSHESLLRELDLYGEQVVTTTSDPATMTLEELHRGISQSVASVESIHVRSTIRHDQFGRVVATPQPGGEDVLELSQPRLEEIDVYVKGTKFFWANLTANRAEAGTGVSIFDGKTSKRLVHFSWRSDGYITTEEDAAKYLPGGDAYFDAVSFYYRRLGDEPGQPRVQGLLPYLDAEFADFRVLDKLELVDGHPCHVITDDWVTLWIDHHHGCAVRRRITFSPCGSWQFTLKDGVTCVNSAVLDRILTCRELCECRDGHWMPTRCRWVDFGGENEPADRRGEPISSIDVAVSAVAVNETPDTQFDYQFPPGTLVTDIPGQRMYWMPASRDQLNDAMAAGSRIRRNGGCDFPEPYEPGWRLKRWLRSCRTLVSSGVDLIRSAGRGSSAWATAAGATMLGLMLMAAIAACRRLVRRSARPLLQDADVLLKSG